MPTKPVATCPLKRSRPSRGCGARLTGGIGSRCPAEGSTSMCPALRTVWVSFDVIGLDCLEAAAASGAEIVGVVTLPGPVDPNRSGQCSFDDIAVRLGADLIEAADINAPEVVAAVGALWPEVIFVVGWSQLVREPFIVTAS